MSGIDPRKLPDCVQRVVFRRLRRCSARVVRRNVIIETGESWIGPEFCGEVASYATVRRGRISPRCAAHAARDAETMNVAIGENAMIEYKGASRPARPQKPDSANPLNGIGCLTHAAAHLFQGTP